MDGVVVIVLPAIDGGEILRAFFNANHAA